jgi:hypothetical protein
MADRQADEPKKVPPRNDLRKSPLYKGSRAAELAGRDPDFVYEYKTLDENHPQCLDKSGALSEHEYGKDVSGFVQVKPWEVVNRQNDSRVKQAEPREDQGKPIDTRVRRGNQVLCRLPREEHEKYAVADAAYTDFIEKQIFSPERRGDGEARMTAVVSRDIAADRTQLLRSAGHPIPGIS